MRFELCILGEWVEVSPNDLYDEAMTSLAVHLERGSVQLEELDGTWWWSWDFSQPARELRVVED